MGAIQGSINQVLGTVAAGAVALDRSPALQEVRDETKELFKETIKAQDEQDLKERTAAQQNVDQTLLQKKLGNMEMENPSESNKESLVGRMAQAVDARKAWEAAKTAQNNLLETQNLKSFFIDRRRAMIQHKLDTGGILGAYSAHKDVLNTNVVKTKGAK